MKWCPWELPLLNLPYLSLFGGATFCYYYPCSLIFTPLPSSRGICLPDYQNSYLKRKATLKTGGVRVGFLFVCFVVVVVVVCIWMLSRATLYYKWGNTNQIQISLIHLLSNWTHQHHGQTSLKVTTQSHGMQTPKGSKLRALNFASSLPKVNTAEPSFPVSFGKRELPSVSYTSSLDT